MATKKYDDFYDDSFGGMDSYAGYGLFREPAMPKDFVFDPKNPPAYGCTPYHPPLPLILKDKEIQIYGSACANPIIKDADIYVSLDDYAPVYEWEQPWNANPKNRQHIRFFIPDMNIPKSPQAFNNCVNFIVDKLDEGKKIHVGCISGHGRTGTVLSAVAQKIMGETFKQDDVSAIDYVRDNYCGKSVEKLSQVLFLYALHGIKVPKRDEKEVTLFKEMFEKEINVSYDEVVASGEFLATMKVLTSLEPKMRAQLYPSKYPAPGAYYPGVKTTNTTTTFTPNPPSVMKTLPAWGPGAKKM